MGDLHSTISPGLRAARSVWNRGEQQRALRMFEDLVRREPNNVRVVLDLAGALASRFEFDRMERVLQRLERRGPHHPGVHHLIGELFARLKVPERAIHYFSRATQCPGVLPETWIELAKLLERRHRLDEARECLERALSPDPDLPEGLLLRAQLDLRQSQPDRAEATLLGLTKSLDTQHPLLPQVWGTLANLFDGRGDVAGAWSAIQACKQAQQRWEHDLWQASETVLKRFRAMLETINPAQFARWLKDPGLENTPRTALFTGFPRSGTTLLEQLLDAHPNIVTSEERDYLAGWFLPSLLAKKPPTAGIPQILDGITVQRLREERRHYLACMEWYLGERVGDRLHVDKNPAYNLVIPVFLRCFPHGRLIIALRDPRDVVLSCYLRYLPLNPVSVRFLTMERTAERYVLDMKAWLQFRDWLPDRWVETRYENLIANVEHEVRGVLSSLDLPWDPSVLNYRQTRGNKPVNSPSYESVARPIYDSAVNRWQRYEAYLAPVLPTLDPILRALGYV